MRSFSFVSIFAATGLFTSAVIAVDRRGTRGPRNQEQYPYPDVAYKVNGLEGSATTTYYDLPGVGACGCGAGSTASSFVWGMAEYHTYFAAASMSIFANGQGDAGWCGPGCGLCFEANNTAQSTSTGGYGGVKDQRVIIVVDDLCPPGNGNENWCRGAGEENAHGYKYHFDIRGTTNPLGDNVVVDFKQVRCPQPVTALRQANCQCQVNTSPDGDDAQARYVSYSKKDSDGEGKKKCKK